MTKAVLGIVGGSGIYDLPGLEKVEELGWGATGGTRRQVDDATGQKRFTLVSCVLPVDLFQ
jgi:purine nucleoside phosphorylase